MEKHFGASENLSGIEAPRNKLRGMRSLFN